MSVQLTIPPLSEEDALRRILTFLRSPNRRTDPFNNPDYGNELYIPNVIYALLEEQRTKHVSEHPVQGMMSFEMNTLENTSPFYPAAWSLVMRGILSPAPVYPSRNGQPTKEIIGAGFTVTDFGRRWLAESAEHECLPSEYSRFGQLLASHASRFGEGYFSRSKEALSCYQGRTYFACCAMCGAATESILLALAVGRRGDEADVLRTYRTGSGRSKIEALVLAQQNSTVTRELPNYTALLHYWRDESAHGSNTSLSEEEAFTSLILLLRFAQFADQRWDELTRNSPGTN